MARTLAQALGIEVPVRMSWNSVKRRSSQAVIDAGKGGVALGIVVGEGARGGLGLDQQLLAVALRRLDVMHDAVAAGEAVLELGGHDRQTAVMGGDRLEKGLGG